MSRGCGDSKTSPTVKRCAAATSEERRAGERALVAGGRVRLGGRIHTSGAKLAVD
jgi:hypothetical protein